MSDISMSDFTLSIITTNKNMTNSGGCPIFYVDNDKELQEKSLLVSKCVGGMVHQIDENTLIVVKH